MTKLLAIALFFCVLQEASVSQVDFQEIPHDWERSLEHAPLIVVARRTGSLELYREWIFPRETHYEKTQETVAREWVQPYDVVEVIRGVTDRPLEQGHSIVVWRSSEYSRSDLEYYHRTGVIHSPIILVQQPAEEIKDGRVVLFLEPHEEVWRYFNDSPEEGEAILHRPSER